MAKTKSLVHSIKFGIAKRAHNCKGNSRHRINQGDLRLEVKNDRDWDKYCVECCERILVKLKSDTENIISDFNSRKGDQ
jgi:hypothetical protein